MPVHNVLMTVECDDPQVFWLASYLETMLLRVWYPVTVATRSWHLRQTIRRFLEKTDDDLAQLPFKLHDFGARGVSSAESAAIGGAAHLVNFMGSDTVLGVLAANRFYREPMAAYSVPAAEHSTITSWGREHEADAYRNMIRRFGLPGAIVSVVSDSTICSPRSICGAASFARPCSIPARRWSCGPIRATRWRSCCRPCARSTHRSARP